MTSHKRKSAPSLPLAALIAKSLRDLAAKTEFPPASHRDYPPSLQDGIAFYLPEGSKLPPGEALTALLKRNDYRTKYSERFLCKKLGYLFVRLLLNPQYQLEQEIDLLLGELDSYSEERKVFIRVEGVLLQGVCVDIGRIRLCPGDEYFLQELAEASERVIDLTLASEELKLRLKEEQNARLNERIKGSCVAMAKLSAEPIRAIELAKEEVRRSLDLLRLGIKATYGPQDDTRIGIAGDHPSALVEAVAISGSSVNTEIKRVGHPLTLDIAFLNTLEKLGIFRVSDALAKERCTNLEEAIIRSVHWFSVALCQDDRCNAFLLLVVSLETLFKQAQGASIASTVAESAAFLLGHTKEQRLEIAKLLRRFYGIRSSVAHSGRSSFTEFDLERLMTIVLAAILEVVSRADSLSTQDELDDTIQLIKYS